MKKGRSQRDLTAPLFCNRVPASTASVIRLVLAGKLITVGLGVPRNPSEAALWLSQASELGDKEASDILRILLIQGRAVQ